MPSLPLKLLAAAIGIVVAAAAQADAAPRKAKKKAVASATASTASVPSRYRNKSLYPQGPVYNGNDYIGDDPDPFIRYQLFRDMSRYGADP
ncbi:MAG: hypothetical protein ACK4UO_01825 [Pseudolabrys sp.]